jgi:hypothetical protein
VVVVEIGGDGFEDVVSSGAGAADEDHLWMIPGVVQTNRVSPGWVAVVFDDVDGMPTEFIDVVDDLALEVVGRGVVRIRGHFSPFPLFCCRALPQG